MVFFRGEIIAEDCLGSSSFVNFLLSLVKKQNFPKYFVLRRSFFGPNRFLILRLILVHFLLDLGYLGRRTDNELLVNTFEEVFNVCEHLHGPRQLSLFDLTVERFPCCLGVLFGHGQNIQNQGFSLSDFVFIGLHLILHDFGHLFQEVSSDFKIRKELSLFLDVEFYQFSWGPAVDPGNAVLQTSHHEFYLLLVFHTGWGSPCPTGLPLWGDSFF